MKDDTALLLDMLLAAEDARSFTASLDWQDFQVSRLHQNAVIRSLEVIGEAASKVSPSFREAHPALPWREMIGMRHRLIHGYGEVQLEIVWDVTQQRLAKLIDALKPLIPPEADPT